MSVLLLTPLKEIHMTNISVTKLIIISRKIATTASISSNSIVASQSIVVVVVRCSLTPCSVGLGGADAIGRLIVLFEVVWLDVTFGFSVDPFGAFVDGSDELSVVFMVTTELTVKILFSP